mgnify:CR=1 FL=1
MRNTIVVYGNIENIPTLKKKYTIKPISNIVNYMFDEYYDEHQTVKAIVTTGNIDWEERFRLQRLIGHNTHYGGHGVTSWVHVNQEALSPSFIVSSPKYIHKAIDCAVALA